MTNRRSSNGGGTEFEGVVERSTVHARPRRLLSASDKARLLRRQGSDDPTVDPERPAEDAPTMGMQGLTTGSERWRRLRGEGW